MKKLVGSRSLRQFVLLLLIILAAGCTPPTPTPTPPPAATPLPPIALVRTEGGSATASARVAPAQGAALALPTSGRVTEGAVQGGEHLGGATTEADDFGTAAANIDDDAIGDGEAVEGAEEGQASFLLAGNDAEIEAKLVADAGDELLGVRGIADGGG